MVQSRGMVMVEPLLCGLKRPNMIRYDRFSNTVLRFQTNCCPLSTTPNLEIAQILIALPLLQKFYEVLREFKNPGQLSL